MKILVAAAFAGSIASTALASGPVVPYEPPVMPPMRTAYNWAGAYVAFGVTYGVGGMDSGGIPDIPSASGAGASLIGGYNWQNGNTVYGAEVALDFASRQGSNDCGIGGVNTCTTRMINHASIRGRLGYAMDNTLVFATLGYSTDERHVFRLNPGLVFSDTQRHNGPMIGIGMEHAMSDTWTVRGDLEHYFMGSRTYAGMPIRADINLVRFSFVRRF